MIAALESMVKRNRREPRTMGPMTLREPNPPKLQAPRSNLSLQRLLGEFGEVIAFISHCLQFIVTQARVVFLKPPRFFYWVETVHGRGR